MLEGKRKLHWAGYGQVPSNVALAAEDAWEISPVDLASPLVEQLCGASIAVVHPNGETGDPARFSALLDEVDSTGAVTLLLLPSESHAAWETACDRHGRIVCAVEDASPTELSAKLSACDALHHVISDLQTELTVARDQIGVAERTVEEIDEEMRLAGKLQQEFLPHRMPEVGPIRFATLFRPAHWVSGDIYDAMRLDETHVGFYVIDAVGHGMPAALLTMFIKKALQTKRIVGSDYEIVQPHVSMTELNADICDQNLASCHFCTAVYCIVDTATGIMQYSRAGHPEPILVHADGTMEELNCRGSLLGIFPAEQYHLRQLQLKPGDRVILYSDGIEDALCGTDPATRQPFAEVIAPLARLPREELIFRLSGAIDDLTETAPPQDDITFLVMDVTE